jgi:hypothetical protein
MDYLWLGVAVILGLIVGLSLRGRKSNGLQTVELGQLRLNMASDRELALFTLRRELANNLVRLDPDRFLHLYRKARAADIEIGKADRKSQEAQLTAITDKYPYYENFDLVGTREHVLYADALSPHPLEDIEAHWLTMVKFHALQRALNSDWQHRAPATSERDLEHLEKYVRKIKDTKFRQRLQAALVQCSVYKRGTGYAIAEGPIEYENDVLTVYRVPHFAENRYGFHFKESRTEGRARDNRHRIEPLRIGCLRSSHRSAAAATAVGGRAHTLSRVVTLRTRSPVDSGAEQGALRHSTGAARLRPRLVSATRRASPLSRNVVRAAVRNIAIRRLAD